MRVPREEYLHQDYFYGQAVYLEAFDEYWILKKLKGEMRERTAAGAVREMFLEYADYELLHVQEKEEKERFLRQVLWALEEVRDSKEWLKAARQSLLTSN